MIQSGLLSIKNSLHSLIFKRLKFVLFVAITSILSLYSVSQLINMATSEDDDLVTQTNHIINPIEDHENRITRHDEDTKRLIAHISKLEEELFKNRVLQW